MKKILKNTKGITLVALVITIIILLILAGISISALTNTGIFQKAKDAKQKSEDAALDQNTKLDEYENEIDKYIPKANSLAKAVKVGDYVAYTPDKLDNNALTTLKTNLKNYSGASDNTTNSAIDREKDLKWRVLDIDETTGQVRLISAAPTSSKVTLRGYNGYNNAVKLLDDACSTLYNSKLATKVQNLKIEDIQDKMKEKDYSKLFSEYGKTQIQPEDKKYPNILAQEKNQKVNGNEGTLNLSKQDNYINQTDVLEANSLELKITAWVKEGENGPGVLTADDFEGDDGQIYSDMFFKDYTYWMSSRCVYANSDIAAFCVSTVYSGFVYFTDGMYASYGDVDITFDYAFRPCITLNSNIQITSGNGTESSPFEIK